MKAPTKQEDTSGCADLPRAPHGSVRSLSTKAHGLAAFEGICSRSILIPPQAAHRRGCALRHDGALLPGEAEAGRQLSTALLPPALTLRPEDPPASTHSRHSSRAASLGSPSRATQPIPDGTGLQPGPRGQSCLSPPVLSQSLGPQTWVMCPVHCLTP